MASESNWLRGAARMKAFGAAVGAGPGLGVEVWNWAGFWVASIAT